MAEICRACKGPVRVQTDPTEGTQYYVPLGDLPWPPLDGPCCPLCARPGVDPAVAAYEPQMGSEEPQTLYGMPVATDERVPPGTVLLRPAASPESVPVVPGPFLSDVYPALTGHEVGLLLTVAQMYLTATSAGVLPPAPMLSSDDLAAVAAKVESFWDPDADHQLVLPASYRRLEEILMQVADAKIRDRDYGDCLACGVRANKQHLDSCWWAKAHAWATLCNVDEIDDRSDVTVQPKPERAGRPVREVLAHVGWLKRSPHLQHVHVSLAQNQRRERLLGELPDRLRELAKLAISQPLRAQELLGRLAEDMES